MPIKGLSEIVRFSRAGHLRIGEKRTSQKGNEYPAAVDHFISDFNDPLVAKRFHDRYGAAPKRVRVAFPGEDPEQFFPQFYCAYGSGAGLKCRGDGVRAQQKAADGQFVEVDCPSPDHCAFGKANGCSAKATLTYFIEGMPGLDVFQTTTGSRNSIININSGIKLLKLLRGGKGIAGVFVDLVLSEQTTQTKEGQKTIYVLSIHIPCDARDVGTLETIFDQPLSLPAPEGDDDGEGVNPPLPEDDEPLETTAAPAGGESTTPLPSRDALYKLLGDHCEGHDLDKNVVSKAIRQRLGVQKFEDITDRQLYDALIDMEVIPVDDIPF